MGSDNPCHNRMGKLDFRLERHLASYYKKDSPPTRVCPLTVNFIQALGTSAQGTTARNIAISDVTWVAFFFLIRPVKYCKVRTYTSHHPFRLRDVQFFIGQQPYNSATLSDAILAQADFVSLLSTTQKNGVKGKSIGHGRTVHPQGGPVAAMCCRVAYLRRNGATGETPISIFNNATSGNRSVETKSRLPSEPSFEQQARQSYSPRRTSSRAPSMWGGYGSPCDSGGIRHFPPGGEVA